ncbi:MAG: hypothetical protein GPI97_23210 [Microcystis aeruginosa W13-16]|nr:hypothetical protein [Microcystis aeruginosa W13-16]
MLRYANTPKTFLCGALRRYLALDFFPKNKGLPNAPLLKQSSSNAPKTFLCGALRQYLALDFFPKNKGLPNTKSCFKKMITISHKLANDS